MESGDESPQSKWQKYVPRTRSVFPSPLAPLPGVPGRGEQADWVATTSRCDIKMHGLEAHATSTHSTRPKLMPAEPAAKPDYAHADIGIVCSLPLELEPFLKRCQRVHTYTGGDFTFKGGRYDGIRVAVVECGMGYARARRATEALIEGHSPSWLLSCGFAGALQPQMKVGNIIVANEIVDQHGQQFSIDIKLASDAARGMYVGRVLTADEIVRTIAEKQALHDQYGAIAVDMESLAVAQVARDRHVRFMGVRAISDDMSADLPSEVLSVMGGSGAVRVGAVIGALWKRPSSMKDMLNLRGHAEAASKSLASFLDGVVHQLHASAGHA